MSDHTALEGRTLLAGKIVSDFGQSSIDCVVRRLSDRGATLKAESHLGIPQRFHLLIANEGSLRPAKLVWQSGNEVGVEFETSGEEPKAAPPEPAERKPDSLVRGEMLALRSAMDEIDTGVLLFDADLRAQFISRAFRKMWDIPDAVADSKPSFVKLLRHNCLSGALEMQADEMDSFIADRVREVRSGERTPRDLRRTDGTVLRVQCAVLPNGGRMLSYADVTDIVRHSDELEALRNALDTISDGVMLLDADLKAQFLNRKVRDYFGVTAEQVNTHPSYRDLIRNAPHAHTHAVSSDQLEKFFDARVEAVRSASPPVRDATTPDGRHIRVHMAVTANGGRMATYCDITDLIHNTELLERLATIDGMTNLYNRRHFMVQSEAEWSRFQRYQRPLSMLMLDIDHFKSVNDRYGHAVGDEVIVAVANACQCGKRNSDAAGRLGGEEFAILLPETEAGQAQVVAERIREAVAAQVFSFQKVRFQITVSIGIAQATLSMSGVDALLRAADEALYQAKHQGRDRIVIRSEPDTPALAAE